MKKALPFVIGAVVLALVVALVASNPGGTQRRMDERVTLREHDKIPYGTRVARELLPSLFPGTDVRLENARAGSWDSLRIGGNNQAVILMADYFDADRDELQELADFVERGNYVFIISRAAADEVGTFFGVSYSNLSSFFGAPVSDSLHVSLKPPAFTAAVDYTYPGKKYDGTFYIKDSAKALVLGQNERGLANFVQLKKGGGSFFLHSAPLAFSNYFILHKANAAYYQQALSVLPTGLRTIVWDEYYLQRPSENKDPNWLGALFSFPAFKWGLLIGLFTLALYLILGMRRRQRMIPLHQKPVNDSLDFVKTLGRLYYDKHDHKNLAEKMAAYFLEHVRSRYKLPTHTLDEAFTQSLHFKSSYPEAETKAIVSSIHAVRLAAAVSDEQLSHFYQQLDAFYQTTGHGRTTNI